MKGGRYKDKEYLETLEKNMLPDITEERIKSKSLISNGVEGLKRRRLLP